MHVKQDKPQNAAEVLKFFDWAFNNGQKLAAELDYVPLPDAVTKVIADAWKAQIKDAIRQADLELRRALTPATPPTGARDGVVRVSSRGDSMRGTL